MSITMALRRARAVQLGSSKWTIIDGDNSNVGGGLWKRIDSDAGARQADAAARLAYSGLAHRVLLGLLTKRMTLPMIGQRPKPRKQHNSVHSPTNI